ncbi:MAG: chromosomal replication initiator protein DnaA [Bacteroidetes bacterium]|nr:chromosomal replication initiator protein DnaA [Bacteroidota bacterium]
MSEDYDALWQACLEILETLVSRQSLKTWFDPLRPVAFEETEGARVLVVQVPSAFYREWINDHYRPRLHEAVDRVLGATGSIRFEINRDLRSDEEFAGEIPEIPRGAGGVPSGISNPFVIPGVKSSEIDSRLNPNYTFERFIEGDCNRLARSAALAIAQNPGGTNYNPFLVYGGVGLGKTHLMQAIGNHLKEKHPDQNVLYVSSERFTSEFVQSIQHNRASEFGQFYRQIDLLIIDDIQFFGGKEKTQEEFFHIFNALHQSGKQIVLSSDRLPREITGIEERLLSRFQWGLTADMQVPELETRTAILNRKADDDGISIDPMVIDFIAENVKTNIRELEGALIRLLAHSTLTGREIDVPMAKSVLADLIKDTRQQLTIESIQRTVCDYFDLPVSLLGAKTRKREVVRARQVAMYLCKQYTQHSLKSIGLNFGGRDHSTVIHAQQSVENQMDTDSTFRRVVQDLQSQIEKRTR